MGFNDQIALRIPEATKASGLGQTTIYEAMRDGRLPFIKIGARRLIKRADLEAFLDSHRVEVA